jgi:hypothetical protein
LQSTTLNLGSEVQIHVSREFADSRKALLFAQEGLSG